MKYLKPSGDANRDLDVIVGNMINIMYDGNYFKDGSLAPAEMHKVPFNVYKIKDIEYNPHLAQGNIFILGAPDIYSALKARFDSKMILIHSVIDNLRVPTGSDGTTEYLLIDNQTDPKRDCVITTYDAAFGASGYSRTVNTLDRSTIAFRWITRDIPKFPVSCINLSFPNMHATDSLSTIIYDNTQLLTLAHNYFGPDFPYVKDYTLYKKYNIFSKTINVDTHHGIMFEILNATTTKPKRDVGGYETRKWASKLEWKEWSTITPIVKKMNIVSWNDQITTANYPKYENESVSEISNNYVCFITGMPIYEDCYALEIKGQYVKETIPATKVAEYLAANAKSKLVQSGKKTVVAKGSAQRKAPVAESAEANAKKTVQVHKYVAYKESKFMLLSAIFYRRGDLIDYLVSNAVDYKIYRTFCPKRCMDVINELDCSKLNLSKNDEERYKGILHAFNGNFRMVNSPGSMLYTEYKGIKYWGFMHFNASDAHAAANGFHESDVLFISVVNKF